MHQMFFRLNGVPVHVGTPLLQHGLLALQDLLRVEDVEEVDGHEEGHGDVLPHGVGHLILGVDHGVLTRERDVIFITDCPNELHTSLYNIPDVLKKPKRT